MQSLIGVAGERPLANALRSYDPGLEQQVVLARQRRLQTALINEAPVPSETEQSSSGQQVETSEAATLPKLHMKTVYHAFNCSNPACEFPLCANAKHRVIKPMNKHVLACRSFKGITDRKCVVCKLMLQLHQISFSNGWNNINVAEEAMNELEEWKKLTPKVGHTRSDVERAPGIAAFDLSLCTTACRSDPTQTIVQPRCSAAFLSSPWKIL